LAPHVVSGSDASANDSLATLLLKFLKNKLRSKVMNEKIPLPQLLMFALSICFWWFLLGSLEMALGLFGLLFVHEMGHVVAAKRKGLAVSMPQFTPFGAYVITERSRSASQDAYIKFAGPLIGGLASVVTMAAGAVIGIPELIQIGVYGTLINLFNLIPLDPMDGGGITQAVSKWFWIPGVALAAYALFSFGLNTFNLIFAALLAQQSYQAFMARAQQRAVSPSYFALPVSSKISILASYLALAGALAWVFFNQNAFLSLVTAWI